MLTKEQLLATTTATGKPVPFTIPDVGVVMIRPLTRKEAMILRSQGEKDVMIMEQIILSLAMVEPSMSEEDVAQWQSVCVAGLLEPLMAEIIHISGMTATLDKETMKSFRNGTGV